MSTPAPLPVVDWSSSVHDAASSGLSVIQDNVLYLFAIPVAWIGFKVVKKVISKVG
jgi:hypothetical protein